MKSTLMALAAISLLAFGCDNPNGNITDGGGHPVDDAHLQPGCFADPDCMEGNKCRIPHCNLVTHKCENQNMVCTPSQQCNVSSCDPGPGYRLDTAGNEGTPCTTTTSRPGTCTGGYCAALPTCYDPVSSYGYLDCSSYSRSRDDENT